ncbi:BLISTER [Striga hermonthica]|uniref:BLISTER n=1 Tax=Striga hermonthica TaxID=68872 RepID=A0A9N7NZF7_STRHE|nr:BLISTER [Striga hermonthica]
MASAQVLKKQEHLEAGKRKLEEFRRKKAAEKAKKNTAASQPPPASDFPNEKQPSANVLVRLTEHNGAGTSDVPAEDRVGLPAVVPDVASKEADTSIKSDFGPSVDTNASNTSLSAMNNDIRSPVQEIFFLNDNEHVDGAGPMSSARIRSAKGNFENRMDGDDRSSAQVMYVPGNDLSLDQVGSIQEVPASSHFTYHGLDNYLSNNTVDRVNDLLPGRSDSISIFPSEVLLKNSSVSTLLPDKLENRGYEANNLTSPPYQESLRSSSSIVYAGLEQKQSAFPHMLEKKFGETTDYMGSTNHSSPWTPGHRYLDNNSDVRSSPNQAPGSSPAAVRRSRPSFLDSIQIPKGPSSSSDNFSEEKDTKLDSKDYPVNGLGSSVSQQSGSSSVTPGDGVGLFNNFVGKRHEFFSQKQNEDFAALEQHIEDLTQEKFSLQRALEASRSLAESLASENSALTDSFNQQGVVVNQLKFELEKVDEELKAQMVQIEAVKIEYANAQLECNAADERAKLLAAEVIGLEEKALRLRSNELKLERQLENSQTEISSFRKKMTSLEKDRQDLLSTIDALQEEKKLLQSKLRKALSGGKSIDLTKTSDNKKNASTSTEDLDTSSTSEPENSNNLGTALLEGDNHGSQLSHENTHLNLEGLHMAIPPDQIRMIQNVNTLIAELTLEKDQLIQALSAESSENSKLLNLNKELTRKLEAQTQRLELLMAQSIAADNPQQRQLDPRVVHESTRYADEGDEVVERVLGWIMKLFPGGPSRRRPGKHL